MRVAAVALVLALLTGCQSQAPATSGLRSRTEVDTPELRSAKLAAGIAPCEPGPADGGGLADVTLPCLGGGEPVALRSVRGPAVLSLWASWCVRCHDELPLYQRLHEETRGRLAVLGVDYEDTRPGAAMDLLRTTGARYPQLADPDSLLAEHYRIIGLPGVLFVDASGEVAFRAMLISSYRQLVDLVAEHTGVRV